MKIKNVFLASLLSKMGVEAKAELVIDDSNGVTLTFPDISDIAEIAEGVAVDAPDGTYVIANGEDVWTLVVLAGAIVSATMEMPASANLLAQAITGSASKQNWVAMANLASDVLAKACFHAKACMITVSPSLSMSLLPSGWPATCKRSNPSNRPLSKSCIEE